MKRSYVTGAPADVYVPKLVARCREFAKTMYFLDTENEAYAKANWHRIGIAESINVPGERPT